MSAGAPADFASRYRAAVAERGRLCVGIDPHPGLLDAWGLTDDVDGLRRFAEIAVAALAPVAAAIKPQVALFERFGSAGFAVLEQTIAGIGAGGSLVVADAKRGDIGSTMDAYASAWLRDGSPLCSDSMTVSPYLGFGSLAPAVEAAQDTGRGVFVLARTSNPEGTAVQTAHAGGGSVAQAIVDAAAEVNRTGPAAVGLVVGATRAHGLDLAAVGGPILAPGVGAQGGTAADVAAIFAGVHEWVLPAVSREILRLGPDRAALSDAVTRMRDDIEAHLRG